MESETIVDFCWTMADPSAIRECLELADASSGFGVRDGLWLVFAVLLAFIIGALAGDKAARS